jgi:hypothetical protein
VSVGDAVVAKLLRPDDLDVDATRAHVIHRVRDESSRRVTWIPRVRRRQDYYAQDSTEFTLTCLLRAWQRALRL